MNHTIQSEAAELMVIKATTTILRSTVYGTSTYTYGDLELAGYRLDTADRSQIAIACMPYSTTDTLYYTRLNLFLPSPRSIFS